ncbi:acyl-CoA dehydrogenase [Glycomyces sp. NPDC047010]|uniref:acyl-CoA dehydrogenase family protein n=1 Tax=Glycomyces sp. NPDC047010 TaxID=3155023 RepID=UPI0033FC4942
MDTATAVLPAATALHDVLYRPETARLHQRWRDLMGTAEFAYPEGRAHQERVLRSYRLLRIVNDSIGDPLAFAADAEQLAMMHEWTGAVDGGLTAVAGIHYNLFLGSLLDLDSGGRDLGEFTALRRTGTFLCTERAHGNDAARMETTATRGPDGFVLHTPHPGAAKFMPNTGPAGGPKSGLVAARLVMDGDDYGVHLFLTPLSDAAGPRPGVRVEVLPETFTGAVDHCATTFDHVRLPHDALVGPLPEHRSGGSGRQRFLRAIGRVTTGKLCMSACGVGAAKLAVTRAVRFAHERTTAGVAQGSTVTLFEHRAHQTRLMDALATTYAVTALHRLAVRRWTDATDETRTEAERLVAVAKGWNTWRSRAVVIECRERCGSRGVFRANGFGDPMANLEGPVTAEGDNLVVWSKAAGELVLGRRSRPERAVVAADLDDPEHLQDLLGAIEDGWHRRAGRRLRDRTARTPQERWNNAVNPALELVDAYACRLAGEALLGMAADAATAEARGMLHTVHRLFAFRRIAAHAGPLLAAGRLTADDVEDLPDLCDGTVIDLAAHALPLVAAFGVDGALAHPLT